MSCWLGCAGCPDCDYEGFPAKRSKRQGQYNTMAKGESRYNPNDRKVAQNTFRVLPTNDYTLQSKANFRSARKEEPGAIPYVWGNFNALNTKDPEKEDSKDVSLLVPMYLQLTPGKNKDGQETAPAVDYAGGLTELCQTLNLTVPEEIANNPVTFTDEEGNETEALNAKLIAEWLNSLGEFVVKTHVKRRPAKPPYPESNQIGYFIQDEVNTKFGEEASVTPIAATGTGGKKK